jgi:hypothetical protein
MPRVAARRGRRDFLRGHDEGQRYHHVRAPGADGAVPVAPSNELAERVRQAVLNPVPDHDAGAKRSVGKELLLRGDRRTHQYILGPVRQPGRASVTPG